MGKQTKTDAGMRLLEMTPTLKSLLQDYIDNHYIDNKEQLLFYDRNKTYVTTSQVNLNFKRLICRYQIIPIHEEITPLSKKKRNKISYKKYTYYKKVGNDFELLKKEPPTDWDKNFNNYYFKDLVAEKEYSQHMLRHTFATRCIENEVDYKTLSEILGHSDIMVTLNTYCDVIGKFKKQQFSKIENMQKDFNVFGTEKAEECNEECNA
jgi:integrase